MYIHSCLLILHSVDLPLHNRPTMPMMRKIINAKEKFTLYFIHLYTACTHFAIYAHVTELYLSICVYCFIQKHNTIAL